MTPTTRHQTPLVFRGSAVATVLAAVGVLGVLASWLPESGAGAALGLVGASLAIGVVPGALVVLAWRPQRDVNLFDLLGTGLAASLVLVQVATLAAIGWHLSVGVTSVGLALFAAAHGVAAIQNQDVRVHVSGGEVWFGLCVLLTGACLYVMGSPFDSTEDAIHVALVRRLRHLAAPSIENTYVVPGVVYTYPFPGVHYLMALVSRAGNLDPLFVYHKMRAFWGCAALVLLFGCARQIFERRAVALASGVVGAVLVLNGSFAAVPNFYWGQLAPYSHVSDVALGVLLPALLLAALQAYQADSGRALGFSAILVVGLLATLTMVHIREVVQFAAYAGAFVVALLVVRPDRPRTGRVAVLLLGAVLLPIVYDLWHSRAVPGVDAAVLVQRQQLRAVAGQMSALDWLGPAKATVPGFLPGFDTLFYGWNPLVLLGGAWLVAASRTAGWLLVGASVLAYAVALRVGGLAWAYIYSTYFEILYTPARNLVFFVHLMAGPLAFALATVIARRSGTVAAALTAGVAVLLATGYRWLGPAMTDHNDLLWGPLVLAYFAAAFYARRRPDAATDPFELAPGRRTGAVAAALVAVAVVVSWSESTSPAAAWSSPAPRTPSALLTGLKCRPLESYQASYGPPGAAPLVVPAFESCPPPLDLIRFAAAAPAEAVLAVDKFADYAPSVFLPQQMTTWPGAGDGFLNQRTLFAPYFRFFDASIRAHGDQPFFNTAESPAERRAFLDGLGVTHVLLNPRVHDMLSPVLQADAGRYRSRFDDGRWALYEVSR